MEVRKAVVRSASVQIPVLVFALSSPKVLWGPAAISAFTIISEITFGFTQLHIASVFMTLFAGVNAAGARR
jgi:hypothetical protein